MTLSIIIPTFNCRERICSAIDSIIMQTFSDWELLIMDGASDEPTLSIIHSYRDDRIHFFSEPDLGIYDAMNKGIERSSGEWLYFLGSDDYLIDSKVLESLFQSNAINEKIDLVYGNVVSRHLDKRNYGEWRITDIEYNRCHQAIFYRKRLFDKFGKYNLKYKVAADFVFNLSVFFNNHIKTLYTPLVIAFYSDGGYSTRIGDDLFWQDFSSIVVRKMFWRLHLYQKTFYLRDFVNKQKSFLVKIPCLLVYICLVFYSNCRSYAKKIIKSVPLSK